MTGVGVRLSEAPDALSQGEVRIRIPLGRRTPSRRTSTLSCRRRVAFGDIHRSGVNQSLHALDSRPGWMTCAAIGGRVNAATAGCTTTGLTNQGGGDSGNRVAVSERRSLPGGLAPWKDPL